jgi:hypothetical protein
MSAKLTTQEAVMGQVIPRQHPAVVLKSHYKALRALLAVALIAIVALATTVVILANDDNGSSSSVQPVAKTAVQSPTQAQQLPAGSRFDGGPDEGTRGPQAPSYWQQANPRTSYQPSPNSGFKERAGGPQMVPIGPGAR